MGLVLEPVEIPCPRPQIAGGHPLGQAEPCGAVLHRGHRHHPVGRPAAVGVVEVPEQAGVGSVGQQRHPAVAVGVLEPVRALSHHRVDFMDEEHAPPLGPNQRTCPVHTATPALCAFEA